MNRPRWEELHSYWEDDGALVDAFNDDLTEEDWQRLLDALHRSTWPLEWDAEPLAPAPRTSDELFRLVDEGFGRLVLLLPEGIRVHCYAYGSFGSDVPYPTSCECDFAKSQVRHQAHLDIFGGFVRTFGQAIRKPVLIADQGAHDAPWMRYDAETDAFARLERPEGVRDNPSLLGAVLFWIVVAFVLGGLALVVYAIAS